MQRARNASRASRSNFLFLESRASLHLQVDKTIVWALRRIPIVECLLGVLPGGLTKKKQ